jgi:hypothetical protein
MFPSPGIALSGRSVRTTTIMNSTKLLWPVLIGVALVSGCASMRQCPVTPGSAAPAPTVKSDHVIELNADGFLVNLTNRQHQVIRKQQQAEEYLNATIFAGLQRSGRTNILLFVHGGMNTRKMGMEHFKSFAQAYTGDNYPIFVVWPSDALSTYAEHLFRVRQGIKAETTGAKMFGYATSPAMLVADLGRAITRLPLVIAHNTRADLATSRPIRNVEKGAVVRQYRDLKHRYAVKIGDDYSTSSERTVRDLTYWPTAPVKYFASALIDGFGKGAWDDMLRRTQEVYPGRMDASLLQALETSMRAETNAVQGIAQSDAPGEAKKGQHYVTRRQQQRIEHYRAAGLPLLVKGLRGRQDADRSRVELTVIGHSMGTIILNRVIRDARLDITNIVYMGAACSIADFENSVLPYMKQHTNTQFFNVSLHPIAEAGEINMLDLTPRGSLLAWIDSFLANPVTERERTLGSWRNLFFSSATGEPVVASFFNNQDGVSFTNRLHFRAFSAGGGEANQLRPPKYQWNKDPLGLPLADRCNTPFKHGEFSDLPYWEPRIWWP